MFANGEELLLASSPVFKRRYAHDGDLMLGCTIGCRFCYYRWISASRDYIGTGKLRRLATPSEMIGFLKESKLFGPSDLLILGARGDASMYPTELLQLLELIEDDEYFRNNLVLALHRPPPSKAVLEAFGHGNFRFGTTITPRGRELGWTVIPDREQVEAVKRLLEAGIPWWKVSVEVGPINSLNLEKAVEVMEELAEAGLRQVVVRGAAFGSFGVDREAELRKMIELGFITREMLKQRVKHEYYVVKNFLTDEAYEWLRERVPELRVHRYTYTLYSETWGIPIARNRGNRVRVSGPTKHPEDAVRRAVEKYGLEVSSVEDRGDHYHVELSGSQPATEDIAMTVGAELEEAVVFDKFRHTPTISDVLFYWRMSLFKPTRLAMKLAGLEECAR